MSSSTSPVSEAKITFTPAACTKGLAATEIHCSAKMMRPRPIRMRPKRPTLVDCLARKSVTPTKISSGASHDRSNERITVTSEVPTSAPSITASAGAVLMRPWPANAATISAVAVLLWMRPGDAEAREERGEALVDALAQHAAQVGAVQAQDARAHDVRAPHEEGDAGEEVEEGLHPAIVLWTRAAAPKGRNSVGQTVRRARIRSPGQRVGLGVGEALHRFLHAFLVAQARVLDAAEGRELQAVARDLADVDRADIGARPRSA